MTDALQNLLRGAARPVLLLTHGFEEDRLAQLSVPADVQHRPLDEAHAPETLSGTVMLAVRDRQRLRLAISALGELGRAHRVVCWIESSGGRAPTLVPRPEWPRLNSLQVTCQGSGLVDARFAGPVRAREVLLEVARYSTEQHRLATGGSAVGVSAAAPNAWPVADPRTRVGGEVERLLDPEQLPVDVVVAPADHARLVVSSAPHPVTGRIPAAVVAPTEPTWAECAVERKRWTAPAHDELGPLDEHVLNPSGFTRSWRHPLGKLVAVPGAPHLLQVKVGDRTHLLDSRRGATDGDVIALRSIQGLSLAWRGAEGPHDYARVVAGLAMAGVPLVTATLPTWARGLLSPEFAGALAAACNLEDPVAREERSIRVRRAALKAHSMQAWRRGLLGGAGAPVPGEPVVSALLVTRRPEQVDFAVRQVARQRGVRLELVLVTHGFELGADEVAKVKEHVADAVVTHADSDMVFGDVLNRAVEHASGDFVVKMDDDDWYGPDFLSDLVLARHYSSADLVGCPAEFMFIEPLWLTVRRPDRTEVYGDFVAGGTILMARADLKALGGFRRLRRSVDAGLLASVRQSGGSVFRAHGLNYLLRRGGGGHTWDPGLAYFISRSRVSDQWRGFEPPSLLEAEDRDRPLRPEMGRTA
jgi:hypothetical protein